LQYANAPKKIYDIFSDMSLVDGKFAELQIFNTSGELEHF